MARTESDSKMLVSVYISEVFLGGMAAVLSFFSWTILIASPLHLASIGLPIGALIRPDVWAERKWLRRATHALAATAFVYISMWMGIIILGMVTG